MAYYDDYLSLGRVDRSANTSLGNKKGSLSNTVEKAMGSIVKSESSPISGVFSLGEKLTDKGLVYAATPASDFICGTLQLAAGMTLHVFTRGRGTPYGLAAGAGHQGSHAQRPGAALARLDERELRPQYDGRCDDRAGGLRTFQLMLDVASSRKQTCAEALKLHNSLALFNPAPMT